jgi:predicted  nucleic acid-binding Zn-ribbon protein
MCPLPALRSQPLQAQQRRILQLEGEVEALRVEAALQQDANAAARGATRAAEARVQELQQELDNNAGEACLTASVCGLGLMPWDLHDA